MAHGESNYAMFTGVLKAYMAIRTDGEIMVLNRYLADFAQGCNAARGIRQASSSCSYQILPKKPLHEYGVIEADLPEFAHSVMTGQGRSDGQQLCAA